MNSFALVKYLNVDELIDVHDDSWSVTNQKDDHDANQNYAGSDCRGDRERPGGMPAPPPPLLPPRLPPLL